jgi:adenylate cyclase
LLAELTKKLFDAGAATVGFDVIFAEADRLTPCRVARKLPDLPDLPPPDWDGVFVATTKG